MKRIQRQRTKGWRMPAGAVYVGRPTRWGNPFTLGEASAQLDVDGWLIKCDGSRADAVSAFNAWLTDRMAVGLIVLTEWLAALRGRDLACWCPLDQPCHADVLLELANR